MVAAATITFVHVWLCYVSDAGEGHGGRAAPEGSRRFLCLSHLHLPQHGSDHAGWSYITTMMKPQHRRDVEVSMRVFFSGHPVYLCVNLFNV